jgi:hypothetical protein
MRGLQPIRWLSGAIAVQFVVAAAMAGLGPSSPAPATKVLGISMDRAGGTGDSGNGKNNGAGNDGKDIVAGGTVTGLFPGAVKDLPVLLRNQNNFDVVVTELRATPADASSLCTAANIRVEAFVGQQSVPKNSTATRALVVRMSNDAPNECKNVEWQLAYSGRAAKR